MNESGHESASNGLRQGLRFNALQDEDEVLDPEDDFVNVQTLSKSTDTKGTCCSKSIESLDPGDNGEDPVHTISLG
ncbi:hypothetical protein V6N13_042890 [Hibiscus sabdariffa]